MMSDQKMKVTFKISEEYPIRTILQLSSSKKKMKMKYSNAVLLPFLMHEMNVFKFINIWVAMSHGNTKNVPVTISPLVRSVV